MVCWFTFPSRMSVMYMTSLNGSNHALCTIKALFIFAWRSVTDLPFCMIPTPNNLRGNDFQNLENSRTCAFNGGVVVTFIGYYYMICNWPTGTLQMALAWLNDLSLRSALCCVLVLYIWVIVFPVKHNNYQITHSHSICCLHD
jgi:hypothetical protein